MQLFDYEEYLEAKISYHMPSFFLMSTFFMETSSLFVVKNNLYFQFCFHIHVLKLVLGSDISHYLLVSTHNVFARMIIHLAYEFDGSNQLELLL